MKSTLLPLLLILGSLSGSAFGVESREVRELSLAEYAIFTSLIIDSNPSSKSLCTENAYACLGPDRSELGLALISAKSSPQALTSLANVMRYGLDGALSEDYTCCVLEKGKKIEKALKKINPEQLVDSCKNEINSFEKKHKNLFAETELAGACAVKEIIKGRVKDLLVSIKNSKKCNVEDF